MISQAQDMLKELYHAGTPRRVYKTPDHESVLDPTQRVRANIERLYSETAHTPTPPLWTKWTPDQWLDKTLDITSRIIDNPKFGSAWAYNLDMKTKFGPQGGNFEWDKVEAQYLRQYQRAAYVPIGASTEEAHEYLLFQVRQRIWKYGPPRIADFITFGPEWAGAPSGANKNSFYAYSTLFKGQHLYPYPYPDVPGERQQRLKCRVINKDAWANVAHIQPAISAIQDWLKKYLPEYFNAWLEPSLYTYPAIARGLRLNLVNFETDYKAMDEGITWRLVELRVMPLCKIIIADEAAYWQFYQFVRLLFQQPIDMGSYYLVGEHSLLSGQVITNFVETVVAVIVNLQLVLTQQLTRRLMFILGDDATVLAKWRANPTTQFLAICKDLGMEAAAEKCRFNTGDVRFCRRTHSWGMPKTYNASGDIVIKGIYPEVLVLNNMVNPEYYGGSLEDVVIASLQRCDNYVGSPAFANIIPFWWGNAILPRQVQQAELIARSSNARNDWWYKVYGTAWHPATSETVRQLEKVQASPVIA